MPQQVDARDPQDEGADDEREGAQKHGAPDGSNRDAGPGGAGGGHTRPRTIETR